jgi:hypothetical protein
MGSKTISVTIEAALSAKTDRLAKKLNLPRAVLIARGLQAVVSQEVAIRSSTDLSFALRICYGPGVAIRSSADLSFA